MCRALVCLLRSCVCVGRGEGYGCEFSVGGAAVLLFPLLSVHDC